MAFIEELAPYNIDVDAISKRWESKDRVKFSTFQAEMDIKLLLIAVRFLIEKVRRYEAERTRSDEA